MHLRYLLLSIPFYSLITSTGFAACPVPQYPSQYEITHQSARLNWSYYGTGAPTYQVQWRPAGNASWTVSPALTSTIHSLTGLTNNTTYEWRVRSICAEGDTSTFTSPLSFRTKCDAPTYPTANDLTHQSARLSWSSAVSGATYEVRWRRAGTTDWTVVGDLTSPSVNLTGLANNMTYEWQVRTLCSPTADSDFTSIMLFQTQCAMPTNPATSRTAVDAAELTWQSSLTNAQFDLQWRAAGTANWTLVTDLNARDYILTGLQNNTTYEWQVRTSCSATEKSAFTNLRIFQTRCTVPNSLYVNSVMHNAAQLSWSSPTNVELQWRAAGAADWTTVADVRSPYRLTGLTNNTTYEWRVRAVCASGIVSDYAYAPTLPLTTRCAMPVGLYGYADSFGGLGLSWSSSVGESFEVQWRVTGTTAWSAATGIMTTAYSLTGLTPNVNYEWRVRQVCSATETSDFAMGQSIQTVCNLPYTLQTDNLTQSSARLSWSSAETEARYELQWRPAGAADWTIVTGLSTTVYSLTGLVSNVSYEWRLRKQCTGGVNSDFTNTQGFTLQCRQLTYANGYSSSPTSAYFEWFGVYTYPPYELQWRLLNATDWNTVSGLQTTGYTLTGLTPNMTYEWRVRSDCSTGGPAGFTSTQTVQTRCVQPISLAVTNITFDRAELYWYSTTRTRYELQYRDVSQADWTVLTLEGPEIEPSTGSSSGSKRYTLYQLIPGRTYTWRIRAICESGIYSDFADGPPITPVCQSPLFTSGYALNNTTLMISWDNGPANTNYGLQWRVFGETNWNVIDNLTVRNYQLNNLKPGVSYEHRVQQVCSADLRSGFSVPQISALPCNGPQNLSLRALSATSAQLSWFINETVPYDVQYRIVGSPDWTSVFVPAGSTNLVTIQGTTSTTYSLTGLTAGGQYECRIRVVCAPGVTSSYSSTATVQLGCPAPVTPFVQVGATVARLSWNDPYGAAAYQVQWRPAGASDWTSATVANGGQSPVAFTLTDLMPNTTYEWRVAGDCGGGDRSAYGPVQSFQTNCPAVQYITVNGTGATQARLSWSVAGSGLFSGTYILQYRTSGSVVWTELSGLTTAAVSLTGLSTNTNYEGRVQAVCGPGASTLGAATPFSPITTFRTQCTYPTNSYATRVEARNATIAWTTNSEDDLPTDLQWRSQNASVWTTVPGLTGSTYSLTGLSPNTTYVVRMRTVCSANNPSDYTPYTSSFTTSALLSSLNLYVSNISAQTAQLARSGVADGQSYVFQWRAQNASVWNTTGPLTATAYLLTGLTNNITYEARIGVVGADGAMTYGSAIVFQTFCIPPTYLNVTNVTTASARLTWFDSQLPVVVQWRVGGATAWNTIPDVVGGVYSLTGLPNNTTYEWRLQTACSPEAASTFVYGLLFRTLCRMPNSPLTQAVTSNSAQLQWNSPGPGSVFTVRYRPVGATDWTTAVNLTTTSYDLTGLTNNATYEWGVATTCGSDGSTAYTSSLPFTTQCGLPDNLQISAITADRALLIWRGGGPTYQLDWRELGSSTWLSAANVTVPYTLMGLTNSKTYEWRVRSTCAVAADGPFATGYTFTTQCPFITYNSESTTGISSTTAQLNWTDRPLVTYKLRWRPAGSAVWTVVPAGVTAPYTLTGLTNNTAYEWQIGPDCQSNYASLQTFQTHCNAPLNLRVDPPMTTSAQLRWDDSGEGVGYELQWRALGSTTWNTISDLTGTTYTLTNLANRTTYEWQVRGQCVNGSGFETTVSFTTADDCALGLHTLRAGSWDDPAVWSCGRVPTAGERAQLRHGVTLPDGHTARARTVQYESGGKLTFGTGARLRLGE